MNSMDLILFLSDGDPSDGDKNNPTDPMLKIKDTIAQGNAKMVICQFRHVYHEPSD